MASGRLPQWVDLPSTTMRRIQTPAATVETVSGLGNDVGSVTIAPSARNPARTTALVPRSCSIISSPTTECSCSSPASSTPSSWSAWATAHMAAPELFMSVEPSP